MVVDEFLFNFIIVIKEALSFKKQIDRVLPKWDLRLKQINQKVKRISLECNSLNVSCYPTIFRIIFSVLFLGGSMY